MKIIIGIFGLVLICIGGVLWWLIAPVGGIETKYILTVPEQQIGFSAAKELKKLGVIRSEFGFILLSTVIGTDREIQPGGYYVHPQMDGLTIVSKLEHKPDLAWVTTKSCLRKEQIGEILAEKLEWSDHEVQRWNSLYASESSEYFEGVYYPDTYLIPYDEAPELVAQRYIDRFSEQFGPLADEFLANDIKWTTGVKIASLIMREAAGNADMKTISGVIWKRLTIGMPLQIDATMQYTRGKHETGWWGSIDLAEKRSESPYNTYLHKGLPPTPICSPSIVAIEAALRPEETECLFYLHDRNKQIHCSPTYEEHLENIDTYLN